MSLIVSILSSVVAAADKEAGVSIDHEDDYQRKITPWKQMLASCDLPHDDLWQTKKMTCRDGLVVVASLIDRIPNLGGKSAVVVVHYREGTGIGWLFDRYLETDQQIFTVAEILSYLVSLHLSMREGSGLLCYNFRGQRKPEGLWKLPEFGLQACGRGQKRIENFKLFFELK